MDDQNSMEQEREQTVIGVRLGYAETALSELKVRVNNHSEKMQAMDTRMGLVEKDLRTIVDNGKQLNNNIRWVLGFLIPALFVLLALGFKAWLGQ